MTKTKTKMVNRILRQPFDVNVHVLWLFALLVATGWLEGRGESPESASSHATPEEWVPVYAHDFEGADALSGLFILDGDYGIARAEDNHVLRLPGQPLGEFGVLWGPRVKEDATAEARVYAESKGRRSPAFGIGVYGISGYRLRVKPAAEVLELVQNDEVVASAPYRWQSHTWTWLRLRMMRESENAWRITGEVWEAGQPEPSGPMIEAVSSSAPSAGKASLWGIPYAGRAIDFDDLILSTRKKDLYQKKSDDLLSPEAGE